MTSNNEPTMLDGAEKEKNGLSICEASSSPLMQIFCPQKGMMADGAHQLNSETQWLLRIRLLAVSLVLLAGTLLFSMRSLLAKGSIHPGEWVTMAILAILIGLVASQRQLSLGVLRLVEIAVFGTMLSHLVVFHLLEILSVAHQGEMFPLTGITYRVALGVFALIMVYGMFIPNDWRRASIVLTSFALLPPLIVASVWFLIIDLRDTIGNSILLADVSYTGLFIFFGIFASVVASQVVSKMRESAAKMREMGMYQLKEKIGSGGMGEVWKAEHALLTRPAAIKIVNPSTNGDSLEAAIARFKREAQTTANLRSPHTVELYDFGVTSSGAFYYVMEYLDGMDLESLVSRFGPQQSERVINILKQAAESLSEAHGKGLVHRDIKPSNLHISRRGLSDDFVTVLDFGLVKVNPTYADDDIKLTSEGTTTGTPAFMAPEMALGREEVDRRADIYALGCVGYWLLTGQLVFDGSTPMEIVVNHIKTPPVAPSLRTEVEIPTCLDKIILSCLEKEPGKRPQDLEQFLEMLNQCHINRPWDRTRAKFWWDSHLPQNGN